MKKIFLSIVIVAVCSVLLVTSCKKEKESSNFVEKFENTPLNLQGITYSNGMLNFQDIEHYKSVVKALDSINIVTDSIAMLDYAHIDLTTEEGIIELDYILDSLGYNENQTLIDFENIFPGFISLRKHLSDLRENFFLSEELIVQNDPDDHFVFDYSERTVLNIDSKVKIGNDVYQIFPEGWKINDIWAYNEELEIGTEFILSSGNENYNNKVERRSSKTCRAGKGISNFRPEVTVSSKYGLFWKLRIGTSLWGGRYLAARSESVKWKPFLGWRPITSTLYARVKGEVSAWVDINGNKLLTTCSQFNTECNQFVDIPFGEAAKKRRNVVHKISTNCNYITSSGKLKGEHVAFRFSPGVIIHNSILFWN